ncbi:MAG: N-formylglutamate amidohydrolase [Myxococcales bacterium]|nr:N-formylglutamate amidohydrolase [Myxococcales bacterium]
MKPRALVLTCEHGGARVPSRYRPLFEGKAARKALGSHRGSDLGALRLAQSLERAFRAPLFASTVTRLLVDLNRSVGHPGLWSEFSRGLDRTERAAVLARHYFPHRQAVESWIDERVRQGHQVVHVGVHSFASSGGGRRRAADLGLLYDPSRRDERAFCSRWKHALNTSEPELRVRRNFPYLGRSDGFVTYLRKAFGPRQYLGIELEANQWLLESRQSQQRVAESVIASLRALMPGGTRTSTGES